MAMTWNNLWIIGPGWHSLPTAYSVRKFCCNLQYHFMQHCKWRVHSAASFQCFVGMLFCFSIISLCILSPFLTETSTGHKCNKEAKAKNTTTAATATHNGKGTLMMTPTMTMTKQWHNNDNYNMKISNGHQQGWWQQPNINNNGKKG